MWSKKIGGPINSLGIILDSCRDTTKAVGKTGELPLLLPLGNMFIMYPCAPGTVARAGVGKKPSLFTEKLLEHMNNTEDVVRIFRRTAFYVHTENKEQTPWYEESLKSEDAADFTL
jgi:hypothetical protein